MICRKCGKEISDNAKFCPYCGQNVNLEVASEETTFQEKSEIKENTIIENKDISTISILMIALTVIILVFSIIGLGVFFNWIMLVLSLIIGTFAIVFYLKKKCVYDFLVFTVNLVLVLLNMGLIVYIYSIK